MKYSARYTNKINLKDFDEIIIDLKDETYDDLLGFLKKYSDKRIIIKIIDSEKFIKEDKINIFMEIEKEYPEFNYTFLISTMGIKEQNAELEELFYEHNFSFYFENFISDLEDMWYVIRHGCSDIIITESLGFCLKDIAPILHSYGIKIRVFPNICQKKHPSGNDIKSFFIRAEDGEYYEPYVDVFEFWGEDEKQEAYKNIYSQSQQWAGPLNQYIIGFYHPVEGRRILPTFAERRLNCGRACLKGGKCRLCDAYIHLSETLKNNDLVLINEEMEITKDTTSLIDID